ncbi:dihydrofolate synthetase fol3 protein [Apiospora arundinis]|uniref:Dihydrofolate synthetase n=1 Tax=Apiospora arundinis TaxID=335852 RepID=A0ABR2JAD3_9PEZI
MIELGLTRIQTLLQKTPQTWKAIHVAGTNGKGSICAYLTAMLRANNISCGRFTSPHLIDRWDCISINDNPVLEAKFRHFENLVKTRNDQLQAGATEFELLAATAFEIFEAEQVEVGVIEVGLGGRLDATNVLKNKAVTVISKIGLDHQAMLGNTLEEIALQKAGIMRAGVPCVVDASNPQNVLDVFESHSKQTGASLIHASPESSEFARSFPSAFEPHQIQNLTAAYEAFKLAYPQYAQSADILMPAIVNMKWRGRLQTLDITPLVKQPREVLLDGAHNSQSAKVLADYVNKRYRVGHPPRPVTWVLAASDGKDFAEVSRHLIRPGDAVAVVEFGPVDGMPWVKAMKTDALLKTMHLEESSAQHNGHQDTLGSIKWAVETAAGGPLVIAGSLYLVSDVLRLLRDEETQSGQT